MAKLGSRKLHIFPKVTKMEFIIGHRIDYDGDRGSESSERPAAYSQHKLTPVPPVFCSFFRSDKELESICFLFFERYGVRPGPGCRFKTWCMNN